MLHLEGLTEGNVQENSFFFIAKKLLWGNCSRLSDQSGNETLRKSKVLFVFEFHIRRHYNETIHFFFHIFFPFCQPNQLKWWFSIILFLLYYLCCFRVTLFILTTLYMSTGWGLNAVGELSGPQTERGGKQRKDETSGVMDDCWL